MTGNEHQVFEMVGEQGFRRLVAEFYRQIPEDDLLGPMYPEADLEGAEERLRDFLIYRFGGPQDYLQKRGNPMLRARHGPFRISPTAATRWMTLMKNAIAAAKLPEEAVVIIQPFLQNVAEFLVNSPETGED